jgi:hypothetical protein
VIAFRYPHPLPYHPLVLIVYAAEAIVLVTSRKTEEHGGITFPFTIISFVLDLGNDLDNNLLASAMRIAVVLFPKALA